jgi:hypothetical protein
MTSRLPPCALVLIIDAYSVIDAGSFGWMAGQVLDCFIMIGWTCDGYWRLVYTPCFFIGL